MIGIYKIQNLINGKVYIGQSVNIARRWKEHRNSAENSRTDSDNAIHRAMKKYGLSNFSFKVIEECLAEELDEKEIYWISYYNSNKEDSGYNLTTGGQGCSGCGKILNEELAEKIRIALRDTKLSQEEISKKYNVSQMSISNINTGTNWLSPKYSYPIRNNYGIKHLCIDCGKEVYRTSNRCEECEKKHRKEQAKKNKPLTREELKDLIRTTPFTRIGEHFGITDNGIRKWCKVFNLPTKKKDIISYSDEEWELI